MIQIGNAGCEMDTSFVRASGGFAWWYVDVVTPEGSGLVLIWSYGLPFLPGYAADARRGRPVLPSSRPSVNLVLYENGSPIFYLLQEHGEQDAGWDGAGSVRIGGSHFRSFVQGDRRVVQVDLGCSVPGTQRRLTGTIRVEGAARRASPGGAADGAGAGDVPHEWTPLTGPATGDVALDFGGRPLVRFVGRAYHDRNGGRVPLHALGIAHWMWGRFPLADRELIYYLLWPSDPAQPPRGIGVTIDEDGNTHIVEGLEVRLVGERRTLAGIPWFRQLRLLLDGRLWLDVRHRATVDSGPFYLRFLSEARNAEGESAVGWGEMCYPNRVDRALHRPFVRMRVHRAHRRSSLWVPLFSGPRSGRIGRLMRHALRGARS